MVLQIKVTVLPLLVTDFRLAGTTTSNLTVLHDPAILIFPLVHFFIGLQERRNHFTLFCSSILCLYSLGCTTSHFSTIYALKCDILVPFLVELTTSDQWSWHKLISTV